MSIKALTTLQHFIGPAQRHAVLCAMRGEERQWFADKLGELAQIVETMPASYQTQDQGENAVAYLHYFAGGVASWYITEKDMGSDEDAEADKGRQVQAFGLADPFGDGAELGYISIEEILENGGELDFHWTPKTLGEIRGKCACGGKVQVEA